MPRQPALFPIPAARRRVLMHAVDAGNFPDGASAAEFVCRRCGATTGWIRATISEARTGLACETCNKGPTDGQ